jgi:molybdopterin converting factor small subunit
MKIRVRLYGGLRRHASSRPLEIDVHKSARVADVIESLGFRSGEVWLTTLDAQLVERDHPLRPGDELLLIPPVGGGNKSNIISRR